METGWGRVSELASERDFWLGLAGAGAGASRAAKGVEQIGREPGIRQQRAGNPSAGSNYGACRLYYRTVHWQPSLLSHILIILQRISFYQQLHSVSWY